MLREDIFVETEEVVILLGIEEEQIGQPLLGEEPFKVPHVGVADAGRTALEHIEACDFSWLAMLMDLEQLADADGQGETFAAGGVLQPLVEVGSVQRNKGARGEPEPPDCQSKSPSVVGGEVRKVDLHTRICEWHGFAIGSDDTSARNDPAPG